MGNQVPPKKFENDRENQRKTVMMFMNLVIGVFCMTSVEGARDAFRANLKRAYTLKHGSGEELVTALRESATAPFRALRLFVRETDSGELKKRVLPALLRDVEEVGM